MYIELTRIGQRFSTIGLLVGTLFLAFSLTPSLLPRGDVVQGVLSGLSMAAGYGVGELGAWLWRYFELPSPRRRIQHLIKLTAAGLCGLLAVVFLWQASHWQNTVRALMEMDEVARLRALVVGVVALLIFLAALFLARLEALLPAHVRPIVITDAGFKVP